MDNQGNEEILGLQVYEFAPPNPPEGWREVAGMYARVKGELFLLPGVAGLDMSSAMLRAAIEEVPFIEELGVAFFPVEFLRKYAVGNGLETIDAYESRLNEESIREREASL